MKKYAICKELIEIKGTQYLEPWLKIGTPTFDKVSQVPDDHILISCHYPPWRSPFKEWIAKGNKYIEIEFGYWGDGERRRESRRITYNGHHNLTMKKPPFSRLHTLTPKIENWKTTRGDYLLVIEPLPAIIEERRGITFIQWRDELLEKLSPHWNGPIKWRSKRSGKNPGRWPSYLEDLKGCHAVVGERTMACVEAVMMGYPAYTTDFSMVSLLMGTDLSAISNPTYPDRTAWLEHISWSQFYPDEFKNSTKVIEMIEQYQINP